MGQKVFFSTTTLVTGLALCWITVVARGWSGFGGVSDKNCDVADGKAEFKSDFD